MEQRHRDSARGLGVTGLKGILPIYSVSPKKEKEPNDLKLKKDCRIECK